MHNGLPSERELRALMTGSAADRAFVDGVLRLAWGRETEPRDALALLHLQLQRAAEAAHAELRAAIGARRWGAKALRELFEAVPPPERDHFVEEVLGIAYPPLGEPEFSSSELMTYTPSGYDEIVYAFDVTGLDATAQLIDLGAGLGKVPMLAALLTGASSVGVELDSDLCAAAKAAASPLGLDRVAFQHADARQVDATVADVVFMYLPFAGEVLDTVLQGLTGLAGERQDSAGRTSRPAPSSPRATRRRYLCAGALDPARYPRLEPVAPARSWLNVYAWR